MQVVLHTDKGIQDYQSEVLRISLFFINSIIVAEFLLFQSGEISENATLCQFSSIIVILAVLMVTILPVAFKRWCYVAAFSRPVIFTVSWGFFVEFKQSVSPSDIFVSFKLDISYLYFFVLLADVPSKLSLTKAPLS